MSRSKQLIINKLSSQNYHKSFLETFMLVYLGYDTLYLYIAYLLTLIVIFTLLRESAAMSKILQNTLVKVILISFRQPKIATCKTSLMCIISRFKNFLISNVSNIYTNMKFLNNGTVCLKWHFEITVSVKIHVEVYFDYKILITC